MGGSDAGLREPHRDAGGFRRAATGPGDPRGSLDMLLSALGSDESGLSAREADRRLVVSGANELARRDRPSWPRELVTQFHASLGAPAVGSRSARRGVV